MTKKKSDIPPNLLALMHPDMPFDDSSLEDKKPEAKGSEANYAAQMAEMQASLKRLEEANSTLQQTNMALMGQSQTNQMPQFGPTTIDLEGLPDPVTDPKAYAEAIVTRGDAVIQARQKALEWQSQQRQDLQAKVDGIWTQFGEAYKGYAGKTDLVEAAASKALAAAKARNIDPNKYMFSATPQFFADTVKILNDWGVKGEGAEEKDEEDTVRTSGIPGGIESSGKLTTAADPDDAKIPSLMEELRSWKQSTGFY